MAAPGCEKTRKRLIVACDGLGTWMNSDSGFVKDSKWPWEKNGHVQTPTNVTRICRAILPESEKEGEDGMQQIVYYQAGVGTGNSIWDHVMGGGTGAGLSEHIREAYSFLANNYQSGDEIFLIGFSRGAFTARSIAGLIACVGLLTKKGLPHFYEVFKDWENQNKSSHVPQFVTPNKVGVLSPEYTKELEKQELSIVQVPIKAVGVWDTVGSLGIPNTGLWPDNPQEYSFVDTKVSPNVEYAFHALALDEKRRPFSPTIWEKPAGQDFPKLLKQCWFPGVHSNVGGSYDDTELADITLAWMISQLDDLLFFDKDYVTWQHDLNLKYYKGRGEGTRSWGLGMIYNSRTKLQALGTPRIREPGRYHAVNPTTGKETDRPLRDTGEHIHACVRVRLGSEKGLGTADSGHYAPEALKEWKLAGVDHAEEVIEDAADQHHRGMHKFRWEHRTDKKQVPLPEDTLGEVELRLLKTYPDVYQNIYSYVPHGQD